MKLTEHFQLSELERSSVASAHQIDNHVPASLIPNLKNLCQQVLEPLRQHFDVPVIISSGYRCPQLNTLVGGVENSQHLTGQAADIHIPDTATGNRWFTWIMDNCSFDQLIKETANRKSFWIHVSCKSDPSQNRHQVINFLKKGGNK